MKKQILAAVSMLLVAANAAAQEPETQCPASPLFDAVTVQQWTQAEGRDKDAFSLWGGLGLNVPDLVLTVRMALAELYYPIDVISSALPADDEQLCSALREFERNAGLTADGTLTGAELSRLSQLASQAHETQLTLPSKLVVDSADYASATGTWVVQGEDIVNPINLSQIECERGPGACREASTSVVGGAISEGSYFYEIVRWTNDEVEAVRDSMCRRLRLNINLATQQVYQTVTDRQGAECLGTDGVPFVAPLGKPRLNTLENGAEISLEYYRARQAEAQRAMPSKVQERLARLGEGGGGGQR